MEVSIFWPTEATNMILLCNLANSADCKFEDPKIVKFDAGAATAQCSDIQYIESNLLTCPVLWLVMQESVIIFLLVNLGP